VNLVKNKNVKLYLKLGQQPWWQCKDRAAYNMIASALERGDIKGDKLIEATSGNTGALAMIAQLMNIDIESSQRTLPKNEQTMRALTM
jgi:cysteine synthase B